LVSLESIKLSSLEFTGALTDECISCSFSLLLFFLSLLLSSLGIQYGLSLPLSVSLGIGLVDSSLLGAGGSIGVFIS
jgi:hypothetical protein